VTGTAQTPGTQTATVALAIFLADFSLSAAPVGTSVAAGNNATYTVTVTPTNGFNQVVILNCGPIPPYTTCTFTPPSLAFAGQAQVTLSSTLTVTTTSQTSHIFPRSPRAGPLKIPPLVGAGIVLLLALAGALAAARPRLRLQFRILALSVAIVLLVLGGACDTYVNPISITPVVNGTPSGNYAITILGSLGLNSKVSRGTTVNLTVTP